MGFLVRDERFLAADTIAREYEQSYADEQADLLNEIGGALDAKDEDQRMALYAEEIAKHLDGDGINAFAEAHGEELRDAHRLSVARDQRSSDR